MALKIGKIKRKPGAVWIGSYHTHNNYAKFNRYMTHQFLQGGHYDLGLHADDEINKATGLLSPLLENRMGRVPSTIEYQVFHQTVPQIEPPPVGKWIMAQPWEYGSLPVTWHEVMKFSVDEIWVNSEHNKNNYIREGISSDRISVIPMGVDPNVFHPKVTPTRLATKKSFKFLFVGETMWYSGVDVVVRAFAEEFLAEEDVCLIVKDFKSASPTARQHNIEMIRQLQQDEDNPEILYIDREMTDEELAGLYAACDCLVYPYRAESFGLPVLEAMACGLPTIVTNWGDALDFCDEERNYFVSSKPVQHNDKNIGGFETIAFPQWVEPQMYEVRYQMRDVQENYQEAQEKGIKASQFVLENFTWKQSYDKIIKRFDALKEKPVYRFKQAELHSKILVGLDAFEKGENDKALEELDNVLTEDPENPIIHLDIGTVYLKRENYKQALIHFEQAVKRDVANASLYSVIGISLFHLNEHALASKFFDKALSIDPLHKGAKESKDTVQHLIRNKPKKKRHLISEEYQPLEELLNLYKTPKPRQTLALSMIVKNEEQFLRQCLESIKDVVDEIVIVDTGSTDKTLEIAEEFSAKVGHFEWNGNFSDARNASIELCESDWILVLDADEVLDPKTRHNVRELIQLHTDNWAGYQLKIRNFSREGNDIDVVEHYMMRLFPNNPELRFTGVIHEQLAPLKEEDQMTFERLASPDVLIQHYGYTGEMMDERDKHQRNLELLKRSIQDEPDAPFHYFNLGLTHRVGKDDEEALEAFLKCVSICEETDYFPTYMGAAYSYLTAVYLSLKQFDEGVKVGERGLKYAKELCENNPDFWVNQGSVHNGMGQYEEAIDCFKKAMKLRSKPFSSPVADKASTTWKPYAGIGNTYLHLKDVDNARIYFKRALKENPDNPEIKLGVAKLSIFLEQYEDAEKFLVALKEEASEDLQPAISAELANLYFKQNKVQEATAVLQTMPNKEEITATVAQVYYKAQRYDEIIKLYTAVIDAEDSNPEGEDYCNRGIAYFKLEQFAEAKADFLKAAEVDNHADALHNLGTLALKDNNIDLAVEYYEKSIASNDELYTPYYDLGKIRIHQENFEEAQKLFAKAYEINPEHIDMLSLYAQVEQVLGNTNQTVELYLDILDLEPDNVEVLIQLGYLLSNSGEYEKALQVFERAMEFDDKNAKLYSGIGLTFLQQEKYEDARNAFLLAHQLSPEDQEIIKATQMADALCGVVPLAK